MADAVKLEADVLGSVLGWKEFFFFLGGGGVGGEERSVLRKKESSPSELTSFFFVADLNSSFLFSNYLSLFSLPGTGS